MAQPPPPPGQGYPGRPPYPQGGPGAPPFPQNGMRPTPPPGPGGPPMMARPGAPPGAGPFPGARPPMPPQQGSLPGARPMMPPPQGSQQNLHSHPGQPPRAAISPRPGMPPGPQGSFGRPPAPGQAPQQFQQQQQQQQQQQPPAPQQPSLAQQMGGMNLGPGAPGQATSPPPAQPDMAPAKTKRSARAYHQEAPAQQPAPGMPGWGAVPAPQQGPGAPPPAPGNQPAWQQEAAARVAQYESMEGANDAALDQVPGQRNVLSQQMAAANQARLLAAQAQAQGRRGMLHAQGGHHGGHGGSISVAAGQAFGGGFPGAGGQPQQQFQQAQAQQGGINQPPHQAGQRLQGPRSKIDPDQIPSPVEAMDADQEFFDREWFATCGRGGLPLSTTDFAAVDQGNCSPKHMRLTTYSVPVSDEMATTSQLPMAIIVQPFAQQRADEAPIPVVECGPSGPPRCRRCRSYINPWAIFVEGGQKWICNLCGTPTEVASDYVCHLDMSGRRADFEMRPELSSGSVEFRVPKEYWAVQAKPPASVLLPVAPALTQAETETLTPDTTGTATDSGYGGSTMGLSGQAGAAARAGTKAASKAASEALGTFSTGQGRTVVRAPRPLTYLFAIDVSFSAVRCGSLKASVEHIRDALYGPKSGATNGDGGAADADASPTGFGLPHGSRVAILTFDRTLHFYNLSPGLEQAQMLVVGDIDEPFVPISQGLLADPWESRSLIETLLEELPTMFTESMVAEAAFGGAVLAAQAALSTMGGQANFFLATIPTVGPGALKHREDTKLYGTDKEKTLFGPADTFYRTAAEECVDAGLGINVWFFPSQYIDVATIGTLSGLTGGELFFLPRFDPVRDGVRLGAQVKRAVLRETGYNATMRIRCSNGLRIAEHHGNFFQRNVTDLELATVDADKAVAALIKHEGKLDEKQEAHFQAAILYTTASGERRVRCHNIAVPVTNLLGNVFRYADLDSTISYYMKEAIVAAHQKSLRDVRHYVTEKCVKILLAYRRNCAAQTSPGQLILPESFKLLPLYALALIKTKALKGGNVTSDVRTYYMRHLRSLGAGATMALLYPRMIALHTMSDDDGEPIKIERPADDGSATTTVVQGMRIKTPPLMRPSYLRMEAHGAYLVENGDMCIIWIGSQANPRLLEDLYGASSLDELDPRMTSLPKLPTRLSRQVRALVTSFASQRGRPAMPVLMAREHRDGTEVEFANSLVEDQNNDAMSYVDYLCHVHRIITAEMSGASGSAAKEAAQQAENHSLWRGW